MSEKRGKRTRRDDDEDGHHSSSGTTSPSPSGDKRKKGEHGEATSTTSSSHASHASHHQGTHHAVKQHAHGKPSDVPVRVYADGIYDLFHFGHARSLEQAKKLFPNTHLLVGVCNDELTHRLKGKTVMTDKERGESLRHCRWVDEVVEDAPWIVTQEFIDKHQIDYVAHGEDIILDENGVDIYKFVKDQGKYQTIKRTDGISTSDIILRIVKHYDDYVRRNLKRGYTGKQMNVGFVKEKQLQMQDKLNDFKQKLKSSVDSVNRWSEEHHINQFLKKFGGEVEKFVSPLRRNSTSDAEYSSDEERGYPHDYDVERQEGDEDEGGQDQEDEEEEEDQE